MRYENIVIEMLMLLCCSPIVGALRHIVSSIQGTAQEFRATYVISQINCKASVMSELRLWYK